MTESSPEVVPPSDEPDAAASTGSGRDAQQATPPPDNGASTGGAGTQASQHGGAPDTGGQAPYSLTGHDDSTEPQSPSGT